MVVLRFHEIKERIEIENKYKCFLNTLLFNFKFLSRNYCLCVKKSYEKNILSAIYPKVLALIGS